MVSGKRLLGVLAALVLLISQTSNASAAGRTTTPISNTILNGKGAPKSSLGNDGDFYIDTRSLLIYGPKSKGRWSSPQSLQGPTGPAGSDGKNGADGRAGTTNAIGINGAQGPIGPQGERGERGEKGETGTAGAAGLPGAMGAAGAPGPIGPAGSNGVPGPQGPQGLAGQTGATGPSEVSVVDIPNWTLATSSAFGLGTSSPVGNLEAGKSYQIYIRVRGTSSLNNIVLGADLISPNNTVTYVFNRSYFRYATLTSIEEIYSFEIFGTIQVGQNNSNLQVRVIDGFGSTASAPLTLTGKAYITLVGSVR